MTTISLLLRYNCYPIDTPNPRGLIWFSDATFLQKNIFYNWKFSKKRPFRQKKDFFDEKKTYFWQYFEKSLLTDQVMEKKTDLWTLRFRSKKINSIRADVFSNVLNLCAVIGRDVTLDSAPGKPWAIWWHFGRKTRIRAYLFGNISRKTYLFEIW